MVHETLKVKLCKVTFIGSENFGWVSGPDLFIKGKTYSAGVFLDGQLKGDYNGTHAFIQTEAGHVIFLNIDKIFIIDLTFEPIEKECTLESIKFYLQDIDIQKWIQDNVVDKYRLFDITPKGNVKVRNNIPSGKGGYAEFMNGHSHIAVMSGDNLLVESRKGFIFYIDFNTDLFDKYERCLEDFTSDNLKKIKYIVENDYSHLWSDK